MQRGVVTKVQTAKGFGFIQDVAGVNYFFHRSGLDRAIRFEDVMEGDTVEFVVGDDAKGPRAERVRVVEL